MTGLVLGTQVAPARQAELKEQIGPINPRVIFVQSPGGIPGVITSQVQGAFAADHQDPAHASTYTLGDRSIRLSIPDPAAVKMTVYWRTSVVPPDPKSDSLVLLDDRLASDDHTIPVPDHVFRPPTRSPSSPNLPLAVFVAVHVDAAIYNFSIAPGQ